MFDLTGKTRSEKKFTLIPKGKYNAIIDKVELKKSQAGAEYYSVTSRIIDDGFKGRLLFDTLMKSGSDKGVQVAIDKIFDILYATGQENKTQVDPAEFVGLKVSVFVGVMKDKKSGEDKNVVNGYAKSTYDDLPF